MLSQSVSQMLYYSVFHPGKYFKPDYTMFLTSYARRTLSFFDEYVNIATLFFFAMNSLVLHINKGRKIIFDSVATQILHTGVKGVTVIVTVSYLLGSVSIFMIKSYGLSESFISGILITVILQYAGPIVIMMIVIGRSGTAIATELGSMKIGSEVEALKVMGIDAIHYVVAPRIVGMILSIFLLNIIFAFMATIGSAFIMSYLATGFSLMKFLDGFFNVLTFSVILENNLKIIGFGIIISTVSCYQGFKVSASSLEIPTMTTQAVGRSIILCFIYFVYITLMFIL